MNTDKARHKLLLTIASLLVALCLAECIARILIPEPRNMRFQQDLQELQERRYDDFADILVNDSDLFWRLKPNTNLQESDGPFFGIISNGQSLREDHEVPREKPPGEVRILFLGDSCTFGYGVAYNKTFTQVSEQLIRAKLPDRAAECMNAGVPGYSLFQGWRYFETEGLKYNPDIAVLNFGWNDYATWDNRSDSSHHAMIKAATPPGLLNGSRLCQLAWRLKHKKPARSKVRQADIRQRVSPTEFDVLLKRIKYLADKHEVQLLILIWPMRNNTDLSVTEELRPELQRHTIAYGESHGGIALDLTPLARQLVAKHGVNAVYFDNGHVTELGHKAIAEAIVDKLQLWLEAKASNQ